MRPVKPIRKMKGFRVGKLGQSIGNGYCGKTHHIARASISPIGTLSVAPTTFDDEPELVLNGEHTGLLELESQTTRRTTYVRGVKWCQSHSTPLITFAICSSFCILSVVILMSASMVMGTLESGVYARLDPIVDNIEPAVVQARTLITNLANAEARLEAEVNHTYNHVIDSMPALKNTNDMLVHTQSILSSVASTAAHPRLHIDIDGAPG